MSINFCLKIYQGSSFFKKVISQKLKLKIAFLIPCPVSGIQYSHRESFKTSLITIFKGYFSLIVITKCWLYSLPCTMHPWAFHPGVCTPTPRPLCCSSSILTGNLLFLLYICVCFVSVISTRMLYFLDPTYKWYHEAFVFFWLISSSVIPSQSMHVAANGKISVFLCLSSIPLCVCVCVCGIPYFLYPFTC